MATHDDCPTTSRRRSSRPRPGAPSVRGSIFPVLDGDGHGATARAAEALGRDRPVRTFFVGLLVAYVAIVGASILLGLLLMHVILPWGGIASGDERFVRLALASPVERARPTHR